MTVGKTRFRNRALQAAIAIAAGGLALPAFALELGAANLRSALGERLVVEIPVRSELPIPAGCIDARVGPVGGMLRPAGLRQRARGVVLSTPRIVSEPMLALTVTVRCPSLPRLSRDYTLFLDPAARIADIKPSVLAPTVAPRPAASTRRDPAPATRTAAVAARRYRVAAGDTVSAIAAGLTPAGQSYWPMVDRIVAANPAAFPGGDPDRLLAGSVLTLPVPAATAVTRGTVAETDAPPRGKAPTLTTVPTPRATPGSDAPAVAAGVPDLSRRAAEARTADAGTTDRLLNVLNAESSATPPPASPFADTDLATPASSAGGVSAETANTGAERGAWTRRLLGLGAGMIVAVVGFAGWRRLTRPARQRAERRAATPRAATAALTTAAGTGDPLAAMPPLTTDMFEPRDDRVGAGTFEPDGAPIPATPRMRRYTDGDIEVAEVGALDTADPTDSVRELDDETVQILEADYEAEFTRTQLLEHETAARALQDGSDAAHDVTIEMQGYDTASDSVRMAGDDDAFAQATEARYIDEPESSDTVAMPGLDLDLELPSTSVILETSGEVLSEALGEDFEVEVDSPRRKKRA